MKIYSQAFLLTNLPHEYSLLRALIKVVGHVSLLLILCKVRCQLLLCFF